MARVKQYFLIKQDIICILHITGENDVAKIKQDNQEGNLFLSVYSKASCDKQGALAWEGQSPIGLVCAEQGSPAPHTPPTDNHECFSLFPLEGSTGQ